MPTQPASAGEVSHASKLDEIWQALSHVTDPELDRSVTEMQFVSAVTLGEDGRVGIRFRLPTYWCAPNFAFMMADDMRAAVSALPWVAAVSVVLDEHMYGETINRGMAEGRSFEDSFGEEADGSLDDVRRIFLLKAFQRRQEAMLLHLRDLGYAPDALVRMTLDELDALSLDEAGTAARSRYLERRGLAGPPAANTLAFVTTEGAPLAVAEFAAHLKRLRSVRVNAEFNGALCSGLLAARYEFDITTPLKSQSPRS